VCLDKASGEEVRFSVNVPGTFHVYMRTGVGTAATKLPVILTEASKTFVWKMPNSSTVEYRFDAIPVELSSTGTVLKRGPGLNEVLVRRKKP